MTKGNAFPDCNKVSAVGGSVESFTRSLMSTGNGFPVFTLAGNILRSEEHQLRGVGVGDVGTMDSEGEFDFCFNIFQPPTHPIHKATIPPNFEQFKPSTAMRSKEFPEYFPPGTVITSPGIEVNITSKVPLYVSGHFYRT